MTSDPTNEKLDYQEVRLRIGPLAKLGCFKSTAENFLVYFVTISLASGPILSLTSWYTVVLYGWIDEINPKL